MRPMITRRTAALAVAATLAAAAPVLAQSGNQSDVPGPNPTGSGAAGGSYQGAGMRLQNELFDQANGHTIFRTAHLGCLLRSAEKVYDDSLARTSTPPSVRRVETLMRSAPSTRSPALADSVAAALARGAAPGSVLDLHARALAAAVDGVMQDRCGCVGDRDGYVEAPQWQRALAAFEDYVHTAPDSALSPPAPELVAIRDALQTVVDRALDLRERR